jgi:sugar phosphate isomerase/epimerase
MMPPMSPEIGCTTRPLTSLSFESACRAIADAGYTDIALFFDVGIDADSAAAHTLQVRDMVHGVGLCPSMLIARVDLDRGASEAVSRYRRIIDHAALLGARWLLDMGAPSPEQGPDYVAVMREVAPHAAGAGVGIGIKPHGGLTLASADLLRAINAVDHPAFSISYDPGNIIYYSRGAERPEDGVQLVAPHVTTLMVKDCLVVDGQPDVMINPGEGWVDFDAVLSGLVKGGFDGPMYVECVAGSDPVDIVANIRAAREFIAGVLERIGRRPGYEAVARCE